MCSEKSNIRVTREPSNFRSENCIESKSHDLEIIRFLSNIFKTVVTVYPNRIQNPTFVWRLLYWILIEPENQIIENFSTRLSNLSYMCRSTRVMQLDQAPRTSGPARTHVPGYEYI